MSKGLLFWVLMILWFIFSLFAGWPRTQGQPPAYWWADSVLLFALFFLLGWAVFGFVVQ